MGNLKSNAFRPEMANVPLINLRNEFNVHFGLINDASFRAQLCGMSTPIQTPWLIWSGMPGPFLSFMIQRAIMGMESYLPGMIVSVAGRRGILTEAVVEGVRNPSRLGRGTADSYYNGLPALIADEFSLQVSDQGLWERTRILYREVRNPLLHGYEVSGERGADATQEVFDHLARLYDWIDSWTDIEELWPGASVLSRIRRSSPPETIGAAGGQSDMADV